MGFPPVDKGSVALRELIQQIDKVYVVIDMKDGRFFMFKGKPTIYSNKDEAKKAARTCNFAEHWSGTLTRYIVKDLPARSVAKLLLELQCES